jgi:hypothetical protein
LKANTAPDSQSLRHVSSPLFKERLEYLQHCASKGYSPTTLRPLATDLLLIQDVLVLPNSSHKLDPTTVKTTIEWAAREPLYRSYKNGRRGREYLAQRALRWLGFMDRLQTVPVATNAYTDLIAVSAGIKEQHFRRFCSRGK